MPRLLRSLALFAGLAGAAFALRATPAGQIDWPAFLARQDLVWAQPPGTWEEAAFIGNGNLGATIYTQGGALAWEGNRADVYHASSRYPMGRAALKTAGQITGGEMRLDLWNAEARGTLRTDRGEVHWRSFAATAPAVIVIELEGTGGETGASLDWIPAEALPAVTAAGPGEFAVALPKDAWVVLASSADAPLPDLSPVVTPAAAQNPYPQRCK